MHKLLPVFLLASTLGLAGCSFVAEDPAAAPDDAASGETSAPAASAILALDGEGLRLVNDQTGATRLIPFGTPSAEAITLIGNARGGPPAETGENSECGAGPLQFSTWSDGLTVWSQDGAFAGWAINAAGPTTMDGLGVGTTRAQLEGGGTTVSLPQSTLGTEFAAGSVYGLLDSPQGAVSTLWAGVSCNFR
jgi:hypothetical protein